MDSSTLTDGRRVYGATANSLGLLWLHPHAAPQLSLLDGDLVIGRDPVCDVMVDSQLVSRRHARFRRNGPIVVAEDLGSRNGLFLDGERVERAQVLPGQLWRIGDALARVMLCSSSSDCTFSEVVRGQWGGPRLRSALAALDRVAASDLSVVIEGESGCGKEGVARALHDRSGRKGQFVALDCASLPEHLAESQLFGHRKGAFTGAERNHTGYLLAASEGTLFLDEVVELPLAVQAKLLRALQEHEVVPVGSTEPVQVDLRLVVAAQQPLIQRVDEGRFRADLYARLRGVSIELPPLRERLEDVPFLFKHFLRGQFGGKPPRVSATLLEQLCLYHWPLNVRELLAVSKQVAVLHGHEPELLREHLPREIRAVEAPVPSVPLVDAGDQRLVPRELTPEAFRQELIKNGGNVVQACQTFGISRSRAYRLIANHGIDLDRLRRDGSI